ncbi:hypothetical protein ACWEGQ_27845, partial [Streptomyces seoulensis]
HIGLVPTVVATHTEPFHISKAIATLDYVSSGGCASSSRPQKGSHPGQQPPGTAATRSGSHPERQHAAPGPERTGPGAATGGRGSSPPRPRRG